MARQAALEVFPVPAAVATARDARIRRLRLAPLAGSTDRARHEHGIRLARMDDDGIRVPDAGRAVGQLLPRLAGVATAVDADAVAHDEIVRTRRRDHHAVDVLEEAAELAPALAAVRALEGAADLHAGVDRVGRPRVEGDVLDV